VVISSFLYQYFKLYGDLDRKIDGVSERLKTIEENPLLVAAKEIRFGYNH